MSNRWFSAIFMLLLTALDTAKIRAIPAFERD
jgi:hypothetical protein